MSLLSPPLCLFCDEPILVADLRRIVVFRTRRLSDPPSAVRCRRCGHVWKVASLRPVLLGMTLMIGSVAAATVLGLKLGLRNDDGLMIAIPVGLLAYAAHALWSPLFARLSPVESGEAVAVTKSLEEELSDYPQYDEEMKEMAERVDWVESVQDPRRTPWRCASCGEENPATFDVCWKCESARPEPSADWPPSAR